MIKEENNELAEMRKGCELRLNGLLLTALALGELLESHTDTPKADGGRPLRHVQMVWEDAADLVTHMQLSAKYCADDVTALLSDLDYYIDLRKAMARTLEQYAGEIEATKGKLRAVQHQAGVWADIYQNLMTIAADVLTAEERAEHEAFKTARLKQAE